MRSACDHQSHHHRAPEISEHGDREYVPEMMLKEQLKLGGDVQQSSKASTWGRPKMLPLLISHIYASAEVSDSGDSQRVGRMLLV